MPLIYNDHTGNFEWQDDPVDPGQAPPQTGTPLDLGSFGVPDNSTNPAGYMDLSYYQTRHDQGLPGAPGLEDMFDLRTGQIKDGFIRTGRGYERRPGVAPVDQYDPSNYPTTTGGGGGGGGGWGYLTEPFRGTPPSYRRGPTLDLPTLGAPPPFSYKEFAKPTKDSMLADPSYGFRLEQGQQALEQSAAGRGVLRTGGTLKHLVDYGQNAASQEYSNIFGREVDAHNLGLSQALGTYGVNWGVTKDVHNALYDERKAEFDPQVRENELMNQRDFDNFLAEYDIFEKNRRRAGDYLTWGAGQGG